MITRNFPSHRHHSFLGCVLGLFLLSNSLNAGCKVKAMFVQPPAGVPEKAVLMVGKSFIDIELPQRNFSPEIELPSGQLPIGVLAVKPPEDQIPKGIPNFIIPENWQSCILLFFHDPDNKVFPARVIPLNASGSEFPLGHTLVFNVSSATVQAKFGTETVRVQPGKSATIKPPRSGSGAFPVAIDCANKGDKQLTSLCRSTWQHEENARQILFITPQPNQKIPRVWGVYDRAALPEPKPN